MTDTSPSTSKIAAHLSKFTYTPSKQGRSIASSPAQSTPNLSPNKRSRPDELISEDVGDGIKAAEISLTSNKRIKLSPKSNPSPSPSPSSRKIPRPYAPPETYAHLKGIGDHMGSNLRVIFCGINPGKMSATKGAHYANPSNRFWKMLHQSGFTPDRLYSPSEDYTLPRIHRIGLTNLVDRVTSEQAELSNLEMKLSVPVFLEKVERWKPVAVVMVGKKIWDNTEAVLKRSLGEMETCDEPRRTSEKSVKMEEEGLVEGDLGEDVKPNIQSTGIHPVKAETFITASPSEDDPKPPKVRFSWEDPRPYKLVHRKASDGQPEQSTLFWVVPSTSGLERTPMPDRIAYASSINAQITRLEGGEIDLRRFIPIDMEGIPSVIADIRRKAGRKV